MSGHWRVQTAVLRIVQEGTVTTAGVFGLNVLTGWDQRRPEWADVAWLAMRVHVGRHGKMGVADVIDVEEQDEPPTRKRKGRPQGDTEPPPPKAPRTATPAERAVRAEQAEPVGGRGQRGASVPLHGPVDVVDYSLEGLQSAFRALSVEEVDANPVKRKREREKDARESMAHEGVEHGHDPTSESTFEGAPSASVPEWVEKERAGAWEARAISAVAANRDLEARLSRANEDRRDSESRLADVTKERDRLAAKVKTLERDLATSRKAKPAAQPAQAVERPEGAEPPPGDRGAVPPVSGTSWPAHKRGMPRPRCAPARCRQCPPACGWP